MPGGVTFLSSLNAAIPTPPTGKVTVFFSLDLNQPAYKDEFGAVRTLVGTLGAQGPVGLDGQDAEEILIPGPVGPAGATGATGATGIGVPGPMGFDGNDAEEVLIPGAIGPQGAAGATGNTGAAGPIGPSVWAMGEDGEDGAMGPPGVSGSAATSTIFRSVVNVTDAQLRSLNTVDVQLVAAQGAGTIVMPLQVSLATNVTATFSVSQTNTIPWGTTGLGATTSFAPGYNATGKKMSIVNASQQNVVLGTSNIENTAIMLHGNVAMTGGSTNGGTNVYVVYIVLTIP